MKLTIEDLIQAAKKLHELSIELKKSLIEESCTHIIENVKNPSGGDYYVLWSKVEEMVVFSGSLSRCERYCKKRNLSYHIRKQKK